MSKPKIIAIVSIVLLIIGGGVFYLFKFQNKKAVVPPSTPTPSASNQSGDLLTFTSEKLGITFEFNPHPDDYASIGVSEKGNKVYVYVGEDAPEVGQWVEVFSKDKNETFEASIRRQILANYPSKSCQIEINKAINHSEGFVMAQISYPAPTDSTADPWAGSIQCNPNYARTNGIRYFLYDPSHSDKFIYFNIGQYTISARPDQPWQNTVRFLQ